MKIRNILSSAIAFLLAAAPQGAVAIEGSPVTIDAFASHSGQTTKALMEAVPGTLSGTATVPQADWLNATCNYGFVLRSASGVNGVLTVTRLSYDLVINGSPGLNGSNAPLTDQAFGAYNSNTAGNVSLRAFSAADALVSTQNVQVNGSTVTGAQKLVMEGLVFTPGSSVRRPEFTAPGQYYSVRIHAVGTYDGIPFDVSDTAYTVTSVSAPLDVQVICFDNGSVSLTWEDTAGETGYSVEVSSDNGATWIPQPFVVPANDTYAVVGGISPNAEDYLFRVKALSAGSSESLASAVVGNRRIVSNRIDGGSWKITVHGYPFALNDLQFSTDLDTWMTAPEGTVILDGTGSTREVSVPMGESPRMFARIRPCSLKVAVPD